MIVTYSTMWESTDAMAQEIADAAMAEGIDVHVFEISATPLAHISRHMMDSRAVAVGSPTLHHGMLYRTAGFLQYISGLKPKDKIGAVFGSYGWSGGATKQMRARMEEIGFEMPFDDMQVQYRPLPEDLAALREWSAQIARAALERGKGQII
jgi:flavorubredoxin